MGVEKTAIAPQETIGEGGLSGEFSTSSYFNATVGALTAYDRGGQRETSIQRAQTLTISGLHPYAESRFSVELPESYSVKRESDYLSITDLETNWVLRAPLWKNIEANPEASAAVIDVFENTRLIFEDNTFQSPFADERFLTTTLQTEEVEDDVIGTLALSRVSATGRAQRKASNLGEEFDENEMLQIVLTPIFLPYR